MNKVEILVNNGFITIDEVYEFIHKYQELKDLADEVERDRFDTYIDPEDDYDYSEPDDEYSKMMQEQTDAFHKEQEELEANNPHNYVDPYDDYDPIEKWSDERLDEEIRKAENKYKTV